MNILDNLVTVLNEEAEDLTAQLHLKSRLLTHLMEQNKLLQRASNEQLPDVSLERSFGLENFPLIQIRSR